MNHNELQEDLAVHLRGGTDRLVWTNTQLGPSGSPRPDVFTVNKSFARFRTDCYEVKVSVSDLRHDVTSGKWQSYRKFGHAVWFAFPRGMAPLELVPKECGVILRGEGWRAARKPVAQVLDTLPRDAWLKLLMTDAELSKEPKGRSMDWWTAQRLAREKFGDELAELYEARRRADDAYERATKMKEKAAAEITEDVERLRRAAREREQRDMESLNYELQDLAAALGIPSGEVTARNIASALRAMRGRLNGRAISSAIELLTQLQSEMSATEAPAMT